jgi:hypothetical protein
VAGSWASQVPQSTSAMRLALASLRPIIPLTLDCAIGGGASPAREHGRVLQDPGIGSSGFCPDQLGTVIAEHLAEGS